MYICTVAYVFGYHTGVYTVCSNIVSYHINNLLAFLVRIELIYNEKVTLSLWFLSHVVYVLHILVFTRVQKNIQQEMSRLVCLYT